ncbi:MAG: hypothetical protein ACKVOO_10070 [Burkholderiaceae bacterium]
MATPNYAYEKRQKELAKKRKKEEKLKKPKPDEQGISEQPGTDTAPTQQPVG